MGFGGRRRAVPRGGGDGGDCGVKPRGNLDEDRKLRVLIGWPHAQSPYPSSLVERCEAALDTPLGKLSTEQLRLLIGQKIGLEFLVEKAIDLIENPEHLFVMFTPLNSRQDKFDLHKIICKVLNPTYNNT